MSITVVRTEVIKKENFQYFSTILIISARLGSLGSFLSQGFLLMSSQGCFFAQLLPL